MQSGGNMRDKSFMDVRMNETARLLTNSDKLASVEIDVCRCEGGDHVSIEAGGRCDLHSETTIVCVNREEQPGELRICDSRFLAGDILPRRARNALNGIREGVALRDAPVEETLEVANVLRGVGFAARAHTVGNKPVQIDRSDVPDERVRKEAGQGEDRGAVLSFRAERPGQDVQKGFVSLGDRHGDGLLKGLEIGPGVVSFGVGPGAFGSGEVFRVKRSAPSVIVRVPTDVVARIGLLGARVGAATMPSGQPCFAAATHARTLPSWLNRFKCGVVRNGRRIAYTVWQWVWKRYIYSLGEWRNGRRWRLKSHPSSPIGLKSPIRRAETPLVFPESIRTAYAAAPSLHVRVWSKR